MPSDGLTSFNGTFTARLNTWQGAGYAKAPPTASTTSSTYLSQTSRRLNGSFNPNTLGTGGTYRFLWGTSSPPGTLTTSNSTTGTSSVARTADISGLVCGQQYRYRARVTNGGATVTGSILNFTISCTVPGITGSTATVNMSEDGSPTAFVAPNLSVSDSDAGTLSWSVSSQPVIQGTATAAGSATATGTGNGESIGYTPPLNFVGIVEFTVRATNTTTTLFDQHTITVDVAAVNDPPEITEGAGPQVLAATLEDTATMHSLNATDPELDAITWSVQSGPNHGSVTFPPGTGNAKTFNFTPGQDATATGTYTVRATSLSQFDEIVVNVPITPVNDSPVIDPIGAQASTEGVALMVTPTVDDPDDPNNGSGALTWSISSGFQAGMSISNTGVFNWTPPLGTPPPPATFNQMYPVTIRVQDDTGGSTPDTESFNITVNPPDTDADMVADYNDYCPGATPSATSTDSTNADADGDGTRGTDADPNDSVGGDVCDIDDDNDGMPDSFELTNSFDPFDGADAGADADGDGVTNLQEYNDGTNPNQENLAIDATGYLTPYDLLPPEPTSIHTQATAVTPVLATPAVSSSATGPYRPGNNTIVWKASNGSDDDLATNDPGNLVADPPTQPFFIRPLASFSVNQQVEENSAATVTVTVSLNGDSPSWSVTPPAVATPATVNYTVSGTANNPADHNAVAGVLNFGVGDYQQDITFNVSTDAVTDPNETVVFTLTAANNAAIGSKNTHRVIIVEANIAPRAELQFSQGGVTVASTYVANGAITIDAMPGDANAAQSL